MKRRFRRLSGGRNRRASMLIVVIWIALALASLLLYFSNSMLLEYRAADQGESGLECDQAIEGARRYMTYIFTNIASSGAVPNVADGDYEAENVPVGDAHFWLIGRDNNATASPTDPTFCLVDEASKLNLNTATPEMLAMLPGMNDDLAASIVNWRNPDGTASQGGAVSQDYELLPEPYAAKNAAFETPEELRWVMDCDPTMLYGEDANRNGVLDPNEDDGDANPPSDNKDGHLDCGLAEYVTTFTREPTTAADGSARINITASGLTRQQMTSALRNLTDQSRAQQIVAKVGTAGLSQITSPLAFYVVCRDAAQMTADEFSQVEGSLMSQNGRGLVNASTASEPVLSALLGGNDPTAGQLIATRSGLDDTTLQSLAWVGDALDAATARQLGPYISTHSYQFTADVVAVGRNGHGFRRCLMVFDTEQQSTPQVIYRRDLTRFGWPLGASRRQEQTLGMGQ